MDTDVDILCFASTCSERPAILDEYGRERIEASLKMLLKLTCKPTIRASGIPARSVRTPTADKHVDIGSVQNVQLGIQRSSLGQESSTVYRSPSITPSAALQQVEHDDSAHKDG